jgi:hypothetical protein
VREHDEFVGRRQALGRTVIGAERRCDVREEARD